MLANVKPENGKYPVQVQRTESFPRHKTWQTIAETKDLSFAIELRDYCLCGILDNKIADMRDFYLSSHNK